MSPRTRRRGLAIAVAVAFVWPALHFGLSRWAGSDPWELFGFAMYTVPHPRVQLELEVTVDGRDRPLRAAGSLRERIAAHARRKATLGRLVSDEAFVRGLLASHPSWEAATLTLHRWRLDLGSARWVVEPESIRVERSSASAGSARAPL
ncbi:MAG: hypothetical protein ACQGVK_18785 [Myxococcota bacterium]